MFSCQKSAKPIAKAGILDLSKYDLSKEAFVPLEGEWEFYPQKLLNPRKDKFDKPVFSTIPNSWNNHKVNGKEMGAFGYATYRLSILLNESHSKILSLKIPYLRTAYKMWINGKKMVTNGHVGKNRSSSNPQYVNHIRSFQVKQNKIEVVIQCSNFHFRKGGFNRNIILGTEEEIYKQFIMTSFYDFFMLGSLCIMSLYHFGLYLQRRKDKSSFFFGIFCLCMFVRVIFTGEYWVTKIFPNFNWELQLKLEYISVFCLLPLFASFVKSIFPLEANDKILKAIYGVSFVFVCIAMLFPARISSHVIILFQLVLLVSMLYGFYIIQIAIRQKRTGSITISLGFSILFLTSINDILYFHKIIPTMSLAPLGTFLFILSQSYILSSLFSHALIAMEKLSEELNNTNIAYSRFVPTEFISLLNKESITEIQLGEQTQKEMTILFSDIRSFTELSEKMTPKENFNFLNSYLNQMGPIIRKHNGYIDKYIGDAIMALFPYSAEDALRAAIEMQKQLKIYNEGRIRSNYEPIRIGIGIHTGNLMLGTIGENERMEGTVISDAVNLASRIENLTKIYGESILMTMETLLELENPEDFMFRILGKVRVKGKKNSVTIVEFYDGRPEYVIELFIHTKSIFEDGVRFFMNKEFSEAIKSFKTVLGINPNDLAAKQYLERSTRLSEKIKSHSLL